jgi:hypothetical protein
MEHNKMQPQEGREITITERRGTTWASGTGGVCPNNIGIPFTGVVIKYDSKGGSINVGGYGFAMENIEWEYADGVYEIY